MNPFLKLLASDPNVSPAFKNVIAHGKADDLLRDVNRAYAEADRKQNPPEDDTEATADSTFVTLELEVVSEVVDRGYFVRRREAGAPVTWFPWAPDAEPVNGVAAFNVPRFWWEKFR